ncbi:SMC5-SMC6 complex localization factor 1 [Pitangus sulphuratus]|nr:SMC5-SMC6 complex localization factor 1 [Pitangus sulphuratus]
MREKDVKRRKGKEKSLKLCPPNIDIRYASSARKWVLTKEYIINSAESGRWLDETTYEWGYEIEKDTHYSPQMQSAPKRWREELTFCSAPGAFHRWKVVLPVKEGDKRMASIRRVLQAGKATICSSHNAEHSITHVFIDDNVCPMQNKKCLSEARHYPLQYLGHYLFENEIQNSEDIQINYEDIQMNYPNEPDQAMSKVQLTRMKNAIIKHMYFAATVIHKFAQTDQLNKCNPQGNTDAIFFAKLCHVLYLILQRDPPWKSLSMLKYYLDLLQCPICKKGTWSLIEMLVRSCIYGKTVCHVKPVSGREDEQKIVHKTLLKFFFDLVKAEVEFLKKSLVERINSQHQQVMPQTVLLKTFWLGNGTSVLFTKHINILADWVILSYRELNRKNDAFRCEIAGLLNAILGTVVEYWIISGFLMDRNVFHQIADDLAQYLAISCDGETALHKACISNNVERLIQLLSFPGTDINVKDYAGWTPLHEACNHGSTVCVHEILQRCPEVDLLSQVDGVTPLHDALSNGHVEIGKLLLQHGGPVLLQQRNSNGKLPLDCVESVALKEELLNLVHPEESIESFYECIEQEFCSQQRELCLILFNKLLLNFCSVYNLSSPLTLTLREVACSNVLPIMAYDNSKMKNTFSEDWLVNTYFKELETFQKLPQFLHEISANMFLFPGEQMKVLLATLETMVEAYQLLNLSSS